MHRREFMTAALASTALATTSIASSEKETMLPIIDTHQHLWDLSKFKLGWVKDGDPLARSFVPADYAKAIEGLNVVKSIYMEVDVVPEQQQAEADYVAELCRGGKTTMVAAVVSGRPGSAGFAKYVGQFKDSKTIKGIRRVLHVPETPAGTCLSKEILRDLQLLGDLGLRFDLCVRANELPDFDKVVAECPGTRFILDHCGNAQVGVTRAEHERWQKDISHIARHKNLVCKVSGIVASAKPGKWSASDLAPIVNHTLDAFGPDRVLFGGDWPVCTLAATYRQWVTALREIVHERSEEAQRKLFHDNAVRQYGLM